MDSEFNDPFLFSRNGMVRFKKIRVGQPTYPFGVLVEMIKSFKDVRPLNVVVRYKDGDRGRQSHFLLKEIPSDAYFVFPETQGYNILDYMELKD